MTKSLAALVGGTLLVAATASAGEHVVSAGAAQERLRESAAARGRDLATVTAFVESADVASTLETVGLDRARVQASVAALDDEELRDIAARVAALDRDPAAGASFTGKQVGLVAALILIVVFIIIIA